eukprot:g39138.t1
MHINVKSRMDLLGPDGLINKSCQTKGFPLSLGRGDWWWFNLKATTPEAFGIRTEGFFVLAQKELDSLTYQSLCLPDRMQQYGVAELKGYYYKDDGLLIWFVANVETFYYLNDQQVLDDPELQAWIKDITEVGFQGIKITGLPTLLCNRMDLIKFLTSIIFTCSAQHAAVNAGQ